MQTNLQFQSDLDKLVAILPQKVRTHLDYEKMNDVIEIVLDIGRVPEIRHAGGEIEYIDCGYVDDEDVSALYSAAEMFVFPSLYEGFGIPVLEAMKCGLPVICSNTSSLPEVIGDCGIQINPILFLGPPGVGKTTKLREISRLVADELKKRVIVVDTSNEIAGDGDTPHPAIGHARRMQVRQPEFQKDIMIEAVENHTPEVIVVDEIGTEAEAQAARTIAERGVMLIATAHGNTLENLIKNPTLSDLVGGIQSVTLGDDEARRRACQKTVLEREKQPTFDIVIEILDRNTLAVYKNTAEAVDYILRGWPIRPEIRKVDKTYEPVKEEVPAQKEESKSIIDEINRLEKKVFPSLERPVEKPSDSLKFGFSREKYVEEVKGLKKVYIYAVSRSIVEKVIERLNLNVELTRNIEEADIVIAHKNFAKGGAKILSIANDLRIRTFFIKTNSMPQIQKVLKDALDIEATEALTGYYDEAERALEEAKAAINKILEGAENIELSPQNQQIRKLQHELVEQHNLKSKSVGEGEERHLKIVGGKDFKG